MTFCISATISMGFMVPLLLSGRREASVGGRDLLVGERELLRRRAAYSAADGPATRPEKVAKPMPEPRWRPGCAVAPQARDPCTTRSPAANRPGMLVAMFSSTQRPPNSPTRPGTTTSLVCCEKALKNR